MKLGILYCLDEWTRHDLHTPKRCSLRASESWVGYQALESVFFFFYFFPFYLLSFSRLRATNRLWSKHWILLLLVMALARCRQTMVILALLLIISFLRFGTRGARSSLYFVIVPIKQLGIFFSLSVFYVAQSTREP